MKTWKLGLVTVLGMGVFWGLSARLEAATTNSVAVLGPGASGFVFNPTNLLITVGDTVRWINQSSTTHDIAEGTFAGGLTPAPYWAKASLGLLGSFSVTFSNLGTYPYVCSTHVFVNPQPAGNPTQTGTVTVAAINFPPSVDLTSPSSGTSLLEPASFTMTATASDSDGNITNIQ